MTSCERITDRCTYHGEGAVWADRWTTAGSGGLRFVDMVAGAVMTLHAGGSTSREDFGAVAACLRPRTGGGFVLAVERGFVLVDPDGTRTALPQLWSDSGLRMNEGGADPEGRFYCGSMAYDQASGAGVLYRLDPDGTQRGVEDGFTIPNGLGFSPDGSTAYHVDTPTHTVFALDHDVETGLSGRRPAFRLPDDQNPDGLTVDADGNLWIAIFGGGAVRSFSPTGELLEVLEVPGASQVTSCAFGGEDLTELYVTTSRENLPDDAEPAAGSLFRATPGVAGLPPLPYGG